MKKHRIVEAEISALSSTGNGIGSYLHPDNTSHPIEVPFTMPGDLVLATLLPKKQSRLHEILQPSERRIKPRCIHFGSCGGCRMQEVPYEDQLKSKENYVLHCFKDLLNKDVIVNPILPCQEIWGYRNKMEYSFSSDAAGNRYLGMVIDQSRGKVFNLTECFLSSQWCVEAVQAVREWWIESGLDAYHMHRDTGSLRTLTLREGQRTGDRMAVLTVSGNPDYAIHQKHLDSFVARLKKLSEKMSLFLRIQQICKGRPTQFFEMLLHGPDHICEVLHVQTHASRPAKTLTFQISPTAFFQPNTAQAEKLYSTALQLANVQAQDTVCDLYCGTGTLGICIASDVQRVIGVEISPEAALDARENAKLNGCHNVTITAGAVRDLQTQMDPPNLLMVDPPRAGMDPIALENVAKMNAKKILFISCNPATQAPNIAALAQKGYRLTHLHPVDQFPHAGHVENIALLEKK